MFIIGFINLKSPRVLINPVPCADVESLYEWIADFLNEKDFKLSQAVTREGLEQALKAMRPIRIDFTGYAAALLLGDSEVVERATDKYAHIDLEALLSNLK